MNTTRWALLLSVVLGGGAAYLLFRPGSAAKAEPAGVDLRESLTPRETSEGHYRVTLTPVSKRVVVGATGSWVAVVRTVSGKPAEKCAVSFDATMPAHGHGLPLAPRVTREPEPGVYLVEGVRFSMPGRWQLWLGVDRCGPKDSTTFDVTL